MPSSLMRREPSLAIWAELLARYAEGGVKAVIAAASRAESAACFGR